MFEKTANTSAQSGPLRRRWPQSLEVTRIASVERKIMGVNSTTEMYERARQDLYASMAYFGIMNDLFYSDTDRCLKACIEKNEAIERNEIDYNELMRTVL